MASSPSSLEKRRLKDRKRNFNPRWEQDFAFINFEGRPLCLICNISLTHFKSCNLKRHYETHHKKFAIDYPPWSELRRNKLLALKMIRTNQHLEDTLPDRDTELVREAGRVIARSVQQSDACLSSAEFCRQLIARVIVILDPSNARLHHLVTTIPLPQQEEVFPWKVNQFEFSAESGRPIDDLIGGHAAVGTVQLASDPPQMSTNPQQSFSDNIRRIEAATGCFICPVCPLSVDSRWLIRPDASTSDAEAFNSHLSTYHDQLKTVRCVYCCEHVQRDQYTVHVGRHFRKSSPSNAVFHCPAEPDCVQQYHCDRFALLEAHWRTQHGNEEQTRFKCPHCARSLTSLALWGAHVQRYTRSLTHCSAPGCLVKSSSRVLVLEHIRKKHVENNSDRTDNAEFLVQETLEVVCGHSEVIASLPNANDASSQPVKTIDLPSEWRSLSKSEEPKFVFLLRCPYCNLNTVRWQNFLSHAAKCPGLVSLAASTGTPASNGGSGDQLMYHCRIYWCSDCQAVSTEKNLVSEHVMYAHDNQSVVCRETLNVKLLNSTGQNIPVNFTPNQMFLNPASVSTLFTSATPLTGQLPQLTPLQFTLPTVNLSEVGNGTHSAMNFAALAAQPLVSQAVIAPLTAHAPLSINPNITALSSSQPTSVINDPSLSLLQSAAALKTLQGLTGVSTPDVSAMSVSDTASAVAVMAALSGFTGFNIANSISSATPLTTVAAPSVTTAVPVSEPNPESNNVTTEDVPLEDPAVDNAASDDAIDPVRSTDDLVSFPFDEEKFRKELSPHIRTNVLDHLVNKMHQFASYFVRILGKENHRRIPVCPECEKVFPYGLGDFKRHLLTVHLEIPREYLKECLRFTYLPKSEEKFQEVQEQLAMRQMKPRTLDSGRRRVPLPYSITILRRLTRHLPMATREFLEQKMQVYSRLSVLVDTRGGFRRYRCNHCNYSSPHALADVRKHILGSHCGISTKHFRHCLQASRLDPVEFTLFSDEKLARLAKDYMHRQHGSEAFRSAGSRSSSPDDNASQNGFTEAGSVLSSNSNSENERKADSDGFVSHFTTVVPGSKTPVTVRIRPPVPPNMSGNSHIESSSPMIQSPSNGARDSPESNPRTPDSNIDYTHSTATENVDMSTTGIDDTEQLIDLPLPFSETVLKLLLEQAYASPAQADDILAKMRIYSSYTLTRVCRGERVIAFRCPCGRSFATTRRPDSKIRAATLADARRHVMGVHARISHDYMTICCQASRLRREHDFELYPDNMLLELATDRSTRLGQSPGFSTVSRSATPLPALKALRELAPASTPVAKRPRLERVSDADNADNADWSEVHSVTSSSGVPMARESTEDERSQLVVALGHENDINDPKRNSKDTIEDPLSHLNLAQSSGTEEVERIIDLPYSLEALRNLVMGYCPPDYFRILEEKMNIYSSLKVFITRRRGRRYFCCSGCSSASPHGMGDIRKHILGVHAKVPERYKAAAMHCSRLSREDNTLLPNHVLLHLAKMKWKGTVIKPLAEIELSQFGARRASAVGLLRPTGQFASQVYQPSTQNRETEKLTALSTPTSTNNNPTSTSVGHDMEASPSNSNDSPCTTSDSPYVLRLNADLINPITEDCSLLYACSVCSRVSDNVAAVRSHVVQEHVQVPAHYCSMCDDQAFCSLKSAATHYREAHPDTEFATGAQFIEHRKALASIRIKDLDNLPSALTVKFKASLDTSNLIDGSFDKDMDDSYDEIDPDDPLSSFKFTPLDDQSTCSNGTLNSSSLVNGTKVSPSPNRPGPSGSSRRKPSKLQLIQLKPESDSPHTNGSGELPVASVLNQVPLE